MLCCGELVCKGVARLQHVKFSGYCLTSAAFDWKLAPSSQLGWCMNPECYPCQEENTRQVPWHWSLCVSQLRHLNHITLFIRLPRYPLWYSTELASVANAAIQTICQWHPAFAPSSPRNDRDGRLKFHYYRKSYHAEGFLLLNTPKARVKASNVPHDT